MTSNFEWDLLVLSEQEINTKDAQNPRYGYCDLQCKHENQSFICKVKAENITHLLLGPNM